VLSENDKIEFQIFRQPKFKQSRKLNKISATYGLLALHNLARAALNDKTDGNFPKLSDYQTCFYVNLKIEFCIKSDGTSSRA
jgi:hypothetical protein